MHFLFILTVLAALAVSDNLPAEPVPDGWLRLLLAASGMLAVPLAAAAGSFWLVDCLRDPLRPHRATLNKVQWVRSLHIALWLVVVGGIVYGLGWPRLVRFNWHLEHTFLLDDLLILTPVLLPMVLSWTAFYELDRRLGTGATFDPECEPSFTRWQYVVLHLRHYVGILLVPVLVLLGIQDIAQIAIPGFRESEMALGVYVTAVVLLVVFFPFVLKHLWQTRSLPSGDLRTRLEHAACQAGFRPRDILVWHTDRMVLNAAVAGFLPSFRYVFLTDALLARLSDAEVQAVFGHEIGHLRHRHLFLRVAAMLAPVSLWLLLRQVAPGMFERFEMYVDLGGAKAQVHAALVTLAAIGSYTLLVFGPYCRLLEGQADLFGCRTLGGQSSTAAVEPFVAALENLAMQSGIDRNASSWQHASIARRVEFLRSLTEEPPREVRFQSRMRWLSGLIVAAVFSPLAWQLAMLWQ